MRKIPCRASSPTSARAATSASTSSIRWCARPRAIPNIDTLTGDSYTVRSTIDPQLQRATETALQDGLARYEVSLGRVQFQGAEANLAEAVRRIEADKNARPKPSRPGSRRSRPRGCRSMTCTGRRRSSSTAPAGKRGGGPPGRPRGRPRDAAVGRQGRGAAHCSSPMMSCSCASSRARARARARNCACVRRCRAPPSCSRTRPAAFSRWRAASPIR